MIPHILRCLSPINLLIYIYYYWLLIINVQFVLTHVLDKQFQCWLDSLSLGLFNNHSLLDLNHFQCWSNSLDWRRWWGRWTIVLRVAWRNFLTFVIVREIIIRVICIIISIANCEHLFLFDHLFGFLLFFLLLFVFLNYLSLLHLFCLFFVFFQLLLFD